MITNTTAGKIAVLLQSLTERLGTEPEQSVEKMLSEMTQSQEDSILKLLQLMEEASCVASVSASESEGGKTEETLEVPVDGSYVPISEHSAICRGCEVGCELKWDDNGAYEGYSCCNGEETARLLATIRKNQMAKALS